MFQRPVTSFSLFFALSTFAPAALARPEGPPPNAAARADWDAAKGTLTLDYHGGRILDAVVTANDSRGKSVPVQFAPEVKTADDKVEQTLTFKAAKGATLTLRGSVTGSGEAFPAETDSEAQERFPMVRNCAGLSRNLRNNAVYDRRRDWVLSGPAAGATRIMPKTDDEKKRTFELTSRGQSLRLTFRPRFYQKHKNLRYYEPWTYKVWDGPVTGYCTWWSYKGGITQDTIDNIIAVFKKKNLVDYGYEYLQIDAGWATGSSPEGYLNWNNKFPGGAKEVVRKIKEAGMKPAIHTAVVFRPGDKIIDKMAKEHPDWFLQTPDGKVLNANTYTLNPFNEEALDGLMRPTYKGLREQGWEYVKIDGQGNLMAWGYSEYPEYFKKHSTTPGEALRRLNRAAYEELGEDIFILGCWSVRPELVGLIDGCRLGRDGYGPAEFQYFNSYEGVVWRNDPDHCDIWPKWVKSRNLPWYMECVDSKPKGPKPDAVAGPDVSDTIVRPCIVTMASGMLMLSDKMEIYEDDRNIEGIKRASPVLFTVPGQLYDYNPIESGRITNNTTDNLKRLPEPRINLRHPQLNHAPQYGKQPVWWMQEIDRPFGHWSVLARFNWREIARHWSRDDLPAEEVRFSDLGLSSRKEYVVYEFWSKRFLGRCKGTFTAPAMDGNNGLQVFAIHEAREHPWVLSTTRHISQGGVSLSEVRWDAGATTLTGKSDVVIDDPYALTVHLPMGYKLASAEMGGKRAKVAVQKGAVSVSIVPAATGAIQWKLRFAR